MSLGVEILLFDSLTSVIYKGVEEPWSAPLSGMAPPRQVDNAAQPGDSDGGPMCVRFGGTGGDWAGHGDQGREGPLQGRAAGTRRRDDGLIESSSYVDPWRRPADVRAKTGR